MPQYVYHCEANDRTVEVRHPINTVLATWLELCYASGENLGETDPEASVRKVLQPVSLSITPSNSELKSMGFTKLVRRDDGVYENVTRLDNESRYMKAGEADTVPDIARRVGD